MEINHYTKKEIEGQPALWQSVFNLLVDKKPEIDEFLAPILATTNLQIILSGAGSSAFVGDAAQGVVQQLSGNTTSAIATTDIVTHPELLLQNSKPVLLVSFARSGNSPESVETVKLVNNVCDEAYHLIISCNKNGELAKYANTHQKNAYAVLLPEEANDKSLAMTGSFTSMLLSTLLIFRKGPLGSAKNEIQKIVKQANQLLGKTEDLQKLAAKNFERVVFLGSGPMLGIAEECHLKLQELSDGEVICKHDSFLGFRHGPRAVITENTLLVYLFSHQEHVYQYELDLVKSIAKDKRKITCLSIGREKENELDSCINIPLEVEENETLSIIPFTLVGQLLGMFTSLKLGLDPDNPSKSGAISRVVQGVKIYDYPKSVKA